jgi:hypothetical protein
MNIKNLRKNYYSLSKRERLILYDAAENRDDQAEMDAVMLATPNVDWIKPDWALQAEQLLKMRLISLINRLKYCRDAMFCFSMAVIVESTDYAEEVAKDEDHLYYESARLSAYFYCISADASDALYEEMGLDVEAWKTKESELFGLDVIEQVTDLQLRELAFNEEEAQAFIDRIGKKRGIENTVLGFTYDRHITGIRNILKKNVFKDFFKT